MIRSMVLKRKWSIGQKIWIKVFFEAKAGIQLGVSLVIHVTSLDVNFNFKWHHYSIAQSFKTSSVIVARFQKVEVHCALALAECCQMTCPTLKNMGFW